MTANERLKRSARRAGSSRQRCAAASLSHLPVGALMSSVVIALLPTAKIQSLP